MKAQFSQPLNQSRPSSHKTNSVRRSQGSNHHLPDIHNTPQRAMFKIKSPSLLLPKKLTPLPFHRDTLRIAKDKIKFMGVEREVHHFPRLSKESPFQSNPKFTIKNYGYLCENIFLDDSTYHKKLMLGQKSSYPSKIRLPPLKPFRPVKSQPHLQTQKITGTYQENTLQYTISENKSGLQTINFNLEDAHKQISMVEEDKSDPQLAKSMTETDQQLPSFKQHQSEMPQSKPIGNGQIDTFDLRSQNKNQERDSIVMSEDYQNQSQLESMINNSQNSSQIREQLKNVVTYAPEYLMYWLQGFWQGFNYKVESMKVRVSKFDDLTKASQEGQEFIVPFKFGLYLMKSEKSSMKILNHCLRKLDVSNQVVKEDEFVLQYDWIWLQKRFEKEPFEVNYCQKLSVEFENNEKMFVHLQEPTLSFMSKGQQVLEFLTPQNLEKIVMNVNENIPLVVQSFIEKQNQKVINQTTEGPLTGRTSNHSSESPSIRIRAKRTRKSITDVKQWESHVWKAPMSHPNGPLITQVTNFTLQSESNESVKRGYTFQEVEEWVMNLEPSKFMQTLIDTTDFSPDSIEFNPEKIGSKKNFVVQKAISGSLTFSIDQDQENLYKFVPPAVKFFTSTGTYCKEVIVSFEVLQSMVKKGFRKSLNDLMIRSCDDFTGDDELDNKIANSSMYMETDQDMEMDSLNNSAYNRSQLGIAEKDIIEEESPQKKPNNQEEEEGIPEDEATSNLATQIQARFRGKKAREEVQKKKEEKARQNQSDQIPAVKAEEEGIPEDEATNNLTTKLQARFRGKKAREEVEQKKQELDIQQVSEEYITNLYSNLDLLDDLVQQGQKPQEEEEGIPEDEATNNLTTKLQARFRGKKAREEVQKKKDEIAKAKEVKDASKGEGEEETIQMSAQFDKPRKELNLK